MEGLKGQISLDFEYKDFFIPDFVCILTNKRYEIYQLHYLSVALVMPKGWELVVKFFFLSKNGHVAYQIEGDDE